MTAGNRQRVRGPANYSSSSRIEEARKSSGPELCNILYISAFFWQTFHSIDRDGANGLFHVE